MDFQAFVDACAVSCAVLSVEKLEDGGYGEIRIVCANQPYKDVMGLAYYDNMLYDELVPHDLKFEDFCYRAAVLGQRMHAYVETRALNCWTDQLLIPLESDRDNLGYCQFLFEFTPAADPERMASVSMDTASAVIEASLTMLGATDFKGSVKKVLRDILRISDGYSCRILTIDHKVKHAETFCEEFAEGVDTASLIDDAAIPYEIASSWEAMIGVSNDIIAKNEREMNDLERRNPVWVQMMRRYGVKSLALIPLRRGVSIFGYLYVINFDVDKVVEVKELLELLSVILGSEISNYLLMRQLEIMSNVDALTGLLNRHAMIRRMNTLSENRAGTPFGVINIDLNGLKPVNDFEGHDAGDRLLVEAAEILQKVFHREDVFRTGGDEFIVVSDGIEEDVFYRKIDRLRSDSQKNSRVSFAIGAFWSDGTVSVREAFQYADERMYTDKRAYYAAHPDERRR